MSLHERLSQLTKDTEEQIKKLPDTAQAEARAQMARLAELAATRDAKGEIPLDALEQAVETLLR